MNEILEAAKKYCDQGFYIIPVKKDKTPASLHGIKDATNNFNTFLKMYRDGYGIGLLTGSINNIYIIDCDVEKDKNHKPILRNGQVVNTGEQNFISKFINQDNANKFKTRTIKTQSGGTHLYYKLKENQQPLKTHQNTSALPKVDFKGEGGYVVAPPTPGKYGKYEVSVDAPIAEMPAELYDFWHDFDLPDDSHEPVYPLNLNDATGNLLIKTAADIFKHPNGKGNENLMAISGALALRGVSIEHTKGIISEAARLNDWHDVNWAVIDNTYNKVKNHQRVLGYTTLKKNIIENKDQYENFDEIINNLESIFEFTNPIALINRAYDENETVEIEKLRTWYNSLKHLGLKQSELDEILLKFKKVVYVSLASLLNATRLRHKGYDNVDLIDDQIYIKIDKVYRSDSSNSYIRRVLNYIFNNNISSKAKTEIILQISDLAKTVDYKDATRFIKFKNDYIYDLDTQEIRPFNDEFVIKLFNFYYDPSAKCPIWLNFINSSVDPNDIPILQESLGYILVRGLPAQNFFVFKGPTRAGKGTVMNIVEDIIGSDNISPIAAPVLFAKDDAHMNLWQLEGKLVNWDGETEPSDLQHIANLKKLSGLDDITSNKKFQHQHSFKNTAKLFFALNSLPKIKLNDSEVESFIARIIIINFLHSHADDADASLREKLDTELPGIFNWMLEGLKRLKNNNFVFSNKHPLAEKTRIYALAADPLKVFCDELIVPGDDEFEPKNLYSMFQKFCAENNVDPSMNVKSLLSFQRQITNILKTREDLNFEKKSRGHDNITYYTGFSVKDHNDNKVSPDFNIDSLPEGPVKESIKEENELLEFEKNQECINGPIHYFQVLRNFEKYDMDYFQGSDIILDSSRVINYKNSAETKYVLLKLIIPDDLIKPPKTWNNDLLSDLKEISENEFNVLSRG